MTRRAAGLRPEPPLRLLPTLLLLAMMLAACGPATSGDVAAGRSGGAAAPIELTVYAAASLQVAIEQIATAYAQAAPGMTISVSTGASSSLRTQIEQGAPADVFLSADTKQADALVERGLADRDARVFARNHLAIIVPTNPRPGISTPRDLARPGVKVIAAGDAVPITVYANQLLANLSSLAGYPPGFVKAYAVNVVSREDDVKAVVAKIELGEGDAAIVYRTDALASDAVATIAIPASANVSAAYAGVAVKASTHPDQASAFLDWLVGPHGQAVLASFGFSPPEP
jgi:molybdate transport system substrate-binding protein